ncbi:uncharacterized protein EV420DRAFT_1637649 [Desarmillaria tabescens]|uniref:RING-type domain-containing protein n=1 Tax=Armillaria tabescens TaxID=1929756 RepID=A0AA39TWR6_ARMTA|nr:uncharacterized protein EV420DRAFT_1637649 [Desarmillaria tabescens]KAK0465524.1 hypothetical protein EV420DRAFT_1637649 [Desarmillaria tabescens]
MSQREPLWYCHECGAESRPLMVRGGVLSSTALIDGYKIPEPACASCHSSFVEKMDNPSDDPRDFGHPLDTGDLDSDVYIRPFMLSRLLYTMPQLDTAALQNLFGISPSRNFEREHRGSFGGRSETSSAPSVTFSVRNDNGIRTYTFGGGNTLGGRPPTMSEFHRDSGVDRHDPSINGSLMAQYLMALLGGPTGSLNEMFARGFGAENGRMGDYVFNQEALDQIITQLMESNAHHPVPATDQIMEKLPREVLEIGSPTLRKDCAVCKEQFSLETEDPGEQVVVTLPCSHPFHEPCILPWLKSSGTCPVCRHQLIAQPEHYSPQPGPSQASGNNRRTPSRSRSPGGDPSGIFQSLFGSSMRFDRSSTGGNSSSSSAPPDQRNSSSSRGGNHVPGGWDDLD